MFCPKCGVENPDDRELCVSCNGELRSTTNQPTVEAKTSGVAIVALVLAILSIFLFIFTLLPAFVCGIVALVQICCSKGRLKGKGFAITGIILPIILLAILMPAIGKVKGKAQRIVCAANLQTLSTAVQYYSHDYDGFPTGDKWCDLLIDDADANEISFKCPNSDKETFCYGFNSNLLEETKHEGITPDMVMMFEIEGGKNVSGGPELLYTLRHNGEGCTIAFVDGHAEFVRTEDFDKLKWTVEE